MEVAILTARAPHVHPVSSRRRSEGSGNSHSSNSAWTMSTLRLVCITICERRMRISWTSRRYGCGSVPGMGLAPTVHIVQNRNGDVANVVSGSRCCLNNGIWGWKLSKNLK